MQAEDCDEAGWAMQIMLLAVHVLSQLPAKALRNQLWLPPLPQASGTGGGDGDNGGRGGTGGGGCVGGEGGESGESGSHGQKR